MVNVYADPIYAMRQEKENIRQWKFLSLESKVQKNVSVREQSFSVDVVN